MFQDHQTISALSCFFDDAKVLRFPNKRVKKIPHESVWGMWGDILCNFGGYLWGILSELFYLSGIDKGSRLGVLRLLKF